MYSLFTIGLLLASGEVVPPPDAHLKVNHLRLPAHGTVHRDFLYGFFDDDWTIRDKSGRAYWGYPHLEVIPLQNHGRKNWKKLEFIRPWHGLNYRHHIARGHLWLSFSPGMLLQMKLEDLREFEGDPQTRKQKARGISLPTLYDKYRAVFAEVDPSLSMLTSGAFPNPGVSGYGSIPVSQTGCMCYLLLKQKKKFEVWEHMNEKDNLEIFDSLFAEDFYFFMRKNEYYFVTESGKLYIAPSPKAGTPRTMKELWTDAKRPIVAVIEDADRDKVWLFAKDKNAGAKLDFFFEMKDTIQAETFDPAKLRRVNIEGRARRLLEYWPLVSAEKSPNKQ